MILPDPIQTANGIFDESVVALMAHTVRAVTNYCLKRYNVDLDFLIYADTHGTILPTAGESTPASILKTTLIAATPRSRVRAIIYIHRHANKNLARICVAHELFHLLTELHAWFEHGRKDWVPVPVSKDIEDKCNQFAWELCKNHDKFNHEDSLRAEHIFFPNRLFDHPFNIDLSKKENWPEGIGLEPSKPFSKKPIMPWPR